MTRKVKRAPKRQQPAPRGRSKALNISKQVVNAKREPAAAPKLAKIKQPQSEPPDHPVPKVQSHDQREVQPDVWSLPQVPWFWNPLALLATQQFMATALATRVMRATWK